MAFWNKKTIESETPEQNKALAHTIVQMQRTTRHAKAFALSANLGSSDKIACVISLLLDQPEWEYALDQESAFENALFAADQFGIKRPFSAEEKELFSFLESHFAGRMMANFAWGLYADQTRQQMRKSA